MREKERFIHQFREVQPKFSRLYAHLLTEVNLNFPQLALLSQLVAGPRLLGKQVRRPLSMTDVGEKLGTSKPAVTNLVDRLEKKGFLKRTPHPKDRRIFLLEIKPKGETLVRRVQGDALEVLLKTLEKFTSREKETVARFYEFLSRVLDEKLKIKDKK